MAMAKGITKRSEDYSRWYLDVIAAAKLADYAPVRGCMVIRPNGYAIWEKMRASLDAMFRQLPLGRTGLRARLGGSHAGQQGHETHDEQRPPSTLGENHARFRVRRRCGSAHLRTPSLHRFFAASTARCAR